MKENIFDAINCKLQIWGKFSSGMILTKAVVQAFVFSLICLLALLQPSVGSAQMLDTLGWQNVIKNNSPAMPGCYAATYPDAQWKNASCGESSKNIFQPMFSAALPAALQYTGPVADIGGYAAEAVGGPIRYAEGSFIDVSGVTNITALSSYPNQDHNVYDDDWFSLQLNTDRFIIPRNSVDYYNLCGVNSQECKGWVQFIYQNDGTKTNYPGERRGYISMMYFIYGAEACPFPVGVMSQSGSCGMFSQNAMNIPSFPATDLHDRVSLRGQSINGLDTVTLTVGDQAYSVVNQSVINALPEVWQRVQFNVFGEGFNLPKAYFNEGSSLTVRTVVDNKTTNAPNCLAGNSDDGRTYETNNLNFNSPCCPYGGGEPSIVYVEGTAPGFTVSECVSLGNKIITPSVTPANGGTIYPSAPLQVPNKAFSTFTVTPNLGFQIASITGCDGVRNGGTFTTAPVTTNCTVVAAFTSGATHVISSSAGANGTISPAGSVEVNSGEAMIFTISPNAGYKATMGGSCGGTLFGNKYITDVIVKNCTVTAAFTPAADTYTVTASAGSGGSISPSGAVVVNWGATRAFTVTPNTNYAISSFGGTCGGSFSGNTYTTNAIYSNCAVTVSFVLRPYTVTASAGTGGSISPSGAVSVNWGAAKTFIVTPSVNYKISSVSGCNGTLNGDNTYTTGAITGDCTVTAAFAVQTYTVMASAGTGGSISPSGAVSVNSGATKAFTVTPATDYVISSVGGTCGGTLSGNIYTTRTITVNTANCTVTAEFILRTYTITASASDGGMISPSGSVTGLAKGTAKTFTIVPHAGYVLSSVGGTCGGALNGQTYTTNQITANCTVTAEFIHLTYTVTASAGTGGSISPSGPVLVNWDATRAFTVTPNTGYTATMGGTCGGTLSGNTYTTSAIHSNCTVTASFTAPPYTVTASAGANGNISPSGAVSVNSGATKAFTVTPNTGYKISSVSGCNGTLSGSTYTTGAITANCTVTAAFAVQAYTVTASAGTGGSISPSGAVSVNSGATKAFTVTPNTGYKISSVSGCNGTLSGNTYTTGAITSDCTVTASFIAHSSTYTVTASAGTGGTIAPSGPVIVNAEAVKTFTVTPNAGYAISSFGGTCGGSFSGNAYTTNSVTDDCTVTALFVSKPTYTVTASAGTGGSISPSGSFEMIPGVSRWLYIYPDTGYTVSSIGGTCGGSTNSSGTSYLIGPITADCTVTVKFAPQTTTTYTVTASAGTGGSISPSGPVSVNSGATRVFTVTPNTGYAISSVGGTCGGTLSGSTYTTNAIYSNCTVSATFYQTPIYYTVTASAGTGGTISPSGASSVSSGTAKTFTVTPNTGYTISYVSGCNGTLSGSTYTTGAITANCTVSAAFYQTPTYTVTANAGTGGSISPSGAVSVNSGATRAFTVTPNTGYAISSVGGTCGGTLSSSTYTTGAITANCTVTATFYQTPIYYTVTASAGTGGSISPSGAVSVNSGATRAFTVTPNTGYAISSVGGTCGGTLSGSTYTTNAIYSNCTVSATFAVQQTPYTVYINYYSPDISISQTGNVLVKPGSTVSVPITMKTAGYAPTLELLEYIGPNTCPVGSMSGTWPDYTYTSGAITNDCKIYFNTLPLFPYTITASAGTGGSISPSGAVPVKPGELKMFTITADSGYTISSSSFGGTCGTSFVGLTSYTPLAYMARTKASNKDCTITATFNRQ